MAMGAADVVARLRVVVSMDTKDAAGKAGKFGSGLSKVTGPALAAGAAIGGIAVKAGDSASRLQQSMGAVDTVFGDSAEQVKAWAEQADSSVGLAASQYGELASTLGAQLKNMGVPMDQIAGQTNDLIGLGADLSATYGGTTADAVAALGSALRGETDPIEKYGIGIKQATIEAKVGKKRLAGMTDEQAKAAKTQATLALITEQSGSAVGAFGREADTAAGQQQRASAAWEDASAALGEQLLPIMASAAKMLAGVAQWVQKNQGLVVTFAAVIGVLAVAIGALNVGLKAYNLYLRISAILAQRAWLAALGPIGLVIAAILAVVAVVVVMYKKFDWFRKFVDKTWSMVKKGAAIAFGYLKTIAAFVIGLIVNYFRMWIAFYRGIFNAVVAVAKWAWRLFWTIASGAIAGVKIVIGGIADKVRDVMHTARDIWATIWGKLKGPAESAIRPVVGLIESMGDAIAGVVDWVRRLIDKIKNISWPKPPGWVSKIIPGGTSTTATTAPGVRVSGVRGPVPAGVTTGGGVTIVVQGALDPVAVAGQIRRILSADDRRRGIVAAGRPAADAGAV